MELPRVLANAATLEDYRREFEDTQEGCMLFSAKRCLRISNLGDAEIVENGPRLTQPIRRPRI